MIWEKLYEIAKKQYNPHDLSPFFYSNHVACAIEAEDGQIFHGFCIEGASGVLNLCAERIAAINMIVNSSQTVIINNLSHEYELEEGKYRVRIIRQATNDTPALRFSETVNGNFEQAKKIRDAKLREFGIPLSKTLVSTELEYKKQKKPKKTTRTKNTEKKKDSKRVDKYIYEIGPNKYRILIKKGSKKEKNSFYFSQFVDGNLAEARRIRDRKLAESKLGMSGTYKGNIKFYDFCVIYFSYYWINYLSIYFFIEST